MQLHGRFAQPRRDLLLGMSMTAAVPPYFDFLIEAFRRGEFGRSVHLGHWNLTDGFDPDALPPLRLEALPELLPLEEIDRVTVTLEMTNEVFDRIEPKLDALVSEHDLTNHVRRG